MRMSDWSSDVCSSDLAPVELETVQLLRPPRDAWQKTAPACGKGIIKVRQKNAGNIADHLRVQEIILHEPLDRRFTLPLGKAHPCRDLLLQIEGQRSEEHTSELQSLMRISYAVFCLKKKNNKRDMHQTTSAKTNHHH